MADIPDININDFDYELPQECIAQFPTEQRDRSKLLIYRDGRIEEDIFASIREYLPAGSLLIYNQTRVIQARLNFAKETGAEIEIFCLEPVSPTREIQQAFECSPAVVWKCLIGNSKRWKSGTLSKPFILNGKKNTLFARRIKRSNGQSLVEFTWEPIELTFSEILIHTGTMPLPPYMHRKAVDADKDRYQTVYAQSEGSVAAPTAGLHFTDRILKELKQKNIQTAEVTLHVGAGTFKPIATDNVVEHEMHTEKIVVAKKTIESLMSNPDRPVIATGTTTVRTLESLYWHGVKLIKKETIGPEIGILQWDPYRKRQTAISVEQSLTAVLENMDLCQLQEIHGETQLMIMPGYRFRLADILITNFHMPRSTLLLLVAAFIGDDWKKAYQYALDHDFRFLSYGDACLFFKY